MTGWVAVIDLDDLALSVVLRTRSGDKEEIILFNQLIN